MSCCHQVSRAASVCLITHSSRSVKLFHESTLSFILKIPRNIVTFETMFTTVLLARLPLTVATLGARCRVRRGGRTVGVVCCRKHDVVAPRRLHHHSFCPPSSSLALFLILLPLSSSFSSSPSFLLPSSLFPSSSSYLCVGFIIFPVPWW